MIIPNRTQAWLGLTGTLLDAVGGLYLTYELLGGRAGPLGLITRAATYGVILGIGYGLPFGPFFGIVSGVGLGGILALEYWRIAYYQRTRGYSPLYNVRASGAARGVVLGAAAIGRFGLRFGLIFAAVNAAFLAVVYHFNFAPVQDYAPQPRLRFSAHARDAALYRALAVGLAGALAGLLTGGHIHAAAFGLTIGVVVGLTGLVLGALTPVLEWWIENLPERTLAFVGVLLIALGLVLQSVQYVAVLLSPR